MAKARTIRKRVRAVRNIRTITRTMELVASARFQKSHQQVLGARPYTDRLTDMVGDLLARGATRSLDHPLMHEVEDVKREVMLVLTSDRGFCGGYNHSVLRVALSRYRQLTEAGYDVAVRVVGKRGAQHLKYRDIEFEEIDLGFEVLPDFAQIGQLATGLIEEFLDRKIGGVEVAFMQYVSSAKQAPAISQILPMAFIEPPSRPMITAGEPTEYRLHPSSEEILKHLFPATARLRLWQCFLDAAVSERLMRISAMRKATENADEMIHELTVNYNRTRQSQITSELAEIVGGRMGA